MLAYFVFITHILTVHHFVKLQCIILSSHSSPFSSSDIVYLPTHSFLPVSGGKFISYHWISSYSQHDDNLAFGTGSFVVSQQLNLVDKCGLSTRVCLDYQLPGLNVHIAAKSQTEHHN